MYTVLHTFRQVLFWAGNQGNHQNFDPSLLAYKAKVSFEKNKNIFFRKIKKANKKNHFAGLPILNIFWQEFHGLVVWLVEWIGVKSIVVAQPIWS